MSSSYSDISSSKLQNRYAGLPIPHLLSLLNPTLIGKMYPT